MLEPYDGKLSRTVLRGVGSRETPRLPGVKTREVVAPAEVAGIEAFGRLMPLGNCRKG